MRKIFSFILCVALVTSNVAAQTFNCSTPVPDKILQFDESTVSALRNQYKGGDALIIQVFAHILCDSDGSNPSISLDDLDARLRYMAEFFQPHNICFVLVGQDYINNTTWNRAFTGDMGKDMFGVNAHSNAIDMYVIKEGVNLAPGAPAGEFSVSTDAVHNFPHEMGHCLGLLHTFDNSRGNECPDGSNCLSTGDLVCDTPADFFGSFNFQSNCVYNGTKTINCGIFPFLVNNKAYKPATNNIMGYFSNCYTQFTPGQGERMRNTILFNPVLLMCLAPADQFITNAVINGEVAYGARNSITIGKIPFFLGNVEIQGSGNGMFRAGSRVDVLPGTLIAPTGTRGVTLGINSLCTEGTSSFEDHTTTYHREKGSAINISKASIDNDVKVSPNPFNFTTTVIYHLSEEKQVNMQIFSSIGQLVAQPIWRQNQSAGQHEYTFEGGNLTPGIYFLILQVGEQKYSKRIVFSK